MELKLYQHIRKHFLKEYIDLFDKSTQEKIEEFDASIGLDEKILDAVKKYLKALNTYLEAQKQNKVTLRYYQILAIYFTEVFLRNRDSKEFEEEVFQDSGIIKSFRNFDNSYRQENEIDITDSFDISPQAVKKQARVFKSVLKLDKNFHIYIHGNRDMIEQGVDKDGRKYYKIYYDQES